MVWGALPLAAVLAGCQPVEQPASSVPTRAGRSGERLGAGGINQGVDLGPIRIEKVATWKWDATAAYTIIHDDLCRDPTTGLLQYAEPELTKRGLHAGFGVVAGDCDRKGLWPEINHALVAHGHELVNHSWDHRCLRADGQICDLSESSVTSDFALEILTAKNTIEAKIPGYKVAVFCFPYDAYDDAAMAVVKASHLGARAAQPGHHGLNAADFPDAFGVTFDVYGDSIENKAPDVLNRFVEHAIGSGGYANRELHGVADASWGSVPLADYRAHLDYVRRKVDTGELWMDGPGAVLRYRFSRAYCGTPVPAPGGIVRFPAPSAHCARYATPLSVILSTGNDAVGINAVQGDAPLEVRKLWARRFVVNINPAGGDALLRGR